MYIYIYIVLLAVRPYTPESIEPFSLIFGKKGQTTTDRHERSVAIEAKEHLCPHFGPETEHETTPNNKTKGEKPRAPRGNPKPQTQRKPNSNTQQQTTNKGPTKRAQSYASTKAQQNTLNKVLS